MPNIEGNSVTKSVKAVGGSLRAASVVLLASALVIPAAVLLSITLVWSWASWIDRNHEKAAETARDVAKGTFVVSKLALFWAWLVAPAGLAGVAAGVGITSAPLIVMLAPFIVAATGATMTVAAALELYSKWRRRSAS